MSVRRFVYSTLTVVSLSGCFPASETYLEPSAEGAFVRGQSCYAGGGPPDLAVISLDPSRPYHPVNSPSVPALKVVAYTSRDDNNTANLAIWASVKDSRIILLDPFGIKARAASDGRELVVEPEKYVLDSSKELIRVFWEPARFKIRIGNARSFIVSLPVIRYLDAMVEIPDITFVEKTEVFLHTINC